MTNFTCFSQKALFMGPNSLRCTKILSQDQPFLSFLANFVLPCKVTFMDNYDGT
jgi:hypothetical protein